MTQSVFQSKLIEYYLRSSQTAVSMLPCTDWFSLAVIDGHKVLFFTGNSADNKIPALLSKKSWVKVSVSDRWLDKIQSKCLW